MPASTSRDDLLASWNEGFAVALASIEALQPRTSSGPSTSGGKRFLVVEALNRSVAHTAYHVGQIVYLAKHFAGPHWTTLSHPEGPVGPGHGGV